MASEIGGPWCLQVPDSRWSLEIFFFFSNKFIHFTVLHRISFCQTALCRLQLCIQLTATPRPPGVTAAAKCQPLWYHLKSDLSIHCIYMIKYADDTAIFALEPSQPAVLMNTLKVFGLFKNRIASAEKLPQLAGDGKQWSGAHFERNPRCIKQEQVDCGSWWLCLEGVSLWDLTAACCQRRQFNVKYIKLNSDISEFKIPLLWCNWNNC